MISSANGDMDMSLKFSLKVHSCHKEGQRCRRGMPLSERLSCADELNPLNEKFKIVIDKGISLGLKA
jgi:hypothetical protein